MADLERIYVVPLRRAKYTPATRRTKRAVKELKLFIAHHMKADEEKVWIDEPVNQVLWSRGIQKPPTRIRVKAVKFEDDGVVEVSLPESGPGRHRKVKEEAAEEPEAKTEGEKDAAAKPAEAAAPAASDATAAPAAASSETAPATPAAGAPPAEKKE